MILRRAARGPDAIISTMLKENRRLCDVCGGDIPKGEKYRVTVVSKEQAQRFRELIGSESDPELIPTTTVDA